MAKILGYEIQKGEYEGRSYENYYLTVEKLCAEKKAEKLAEGTIAHVQKVKGKVVRDFEVKLRVAGKGGLIGKNVQFLFDAYKNVALIELIE